MAPSQDTYIDDDEDVCPLCIEELDLSDRNFRPCPCGYQICQFCFNNIKNNMNSLCPACRRPYDEKTIQWKVVTPEEIAEFRANIQKNQKKRAAEQRQKEVQKREAEKENRKNLVGVRVVQKNLVYVTGLTPTVREDELLRTLRRPEFFGQYGNIQKISISNRKSGDGQQHSLGIYVTFERKEDAAKCIQAVNGSQNGDRVLRAQLGTTKYCSAWLRHETCTNRQCMFLHELGDEEDSYTRQDLSSMNSISTQRPLANPGPRTTSRQQPHPSPAPHAAQPMVRSSSKEESENGDGSALPSSANWARNPQVRSRRGSHATSGAAPSPAISHALPVTAESAQEAIEESSSPIEATPGPSTAAVAPSAKTSKTPLEKAKRIPQDALTALLKSLSGCTLVFPKVDDSQSFDAAFPPLFDARGWEKRRAMREEEDSGIAEDQEHAVDAREPSEGEPESSGSRALGGEPEDREHGRDGLDFDLRRNAQPPIQRSNTDGPFGPALGSGFSQAGTNLGSVGSRTMTPQQPAFMRPQGAFVDHLPPGISTQANLFQGQGHNRQGSRFNFANDNRDATSATSVKLSANPRIMAQQSSMMPSTFHNQPGGQYYASSMPGPPPGLKSTGTPPSMFGQHGGFGSAFGASKDSNEILQLLNRGRGAGNQAHDAGKLDLADPSILQARMQSQQHLQQQSNAGLGQGLFGGQSQDDDLLPLEGAAIIVDALVSDEPVDVNIRQPPGAFESFGRSSTPSAPPGLGLAQNHSHPSPAISHSSLLGPNVGRQTPPVALPIIPTKPTATTSTAPLTSKKTAAVSSASEAKKNVKALAAETGLSKEIAKAKSQKTLQDEDFPALGTPKISQPAPTPAVPSKVIAGKASASSGKKAVEKPTEKDKDKEKPAPPAVTNLPRAESRAAEKRPTPGILNIAAATKAAQGKKSVDPSPAADKSSADKDAAFPALPTPTAASVSSPLTRAAPKTLRLVPTPKTEVPPVPAGSGAPVPAGPSARSAAAAAIRPETPVSELISDSASIISASISASRTNSPPPNRVGTAPVRTTTKSQQRKQRKEATKLESASIAAQPIKPEAPEAEIAPIIGRKKKQKKEKEKAVSHTPTPMASRPETPLPAPSAPAPIKEVKGTKEETSTYRSTVNETMTLTDDTPLRKTRDGDTKGKGIDGSKSSSPSSPKALPTSAMVLQDLQKASLMPTNIDDLALFKPISFQNDKPRHDATSAINSDHGGKNSITPTKSIVTEEDQAILVSGKPVRKIIDGVRILLTPYGDCVRNLTEEEEDQFLELQGRVAEMGLDPAVFVSSRHEAANGFSLIKGRAVPNGVPSYFPQGPGMYPSDPVNKIQREEAIYYINQYVLPRLNLNARDIQFPGPSPEPTGKVTRAAETKLTSLVPWIYGPQQPKTAPAAPEVNYPGPVGSFADDDSDNATLASYLIGTDQSLSIPPPPGIGGMGNKDYDMLPAFLPGSRDANKHAMNLGTMNPGPFGSVPLMSYDDAEQALSLARKESEKLEKALNQLMRKNRRLLSSMGGSGGH